MKEQQFDIKGLDTPKGFKEVIHQTLPDGSLLQKFLPRRPHRKAYSPQGRLKDLGKGY